MLQKVSPILPSLNIQATSLFFKEKLNFKISYFENLLVVSKEGIEIFFVELKDRSAFRPAACYIFVNNIEDMYAGFSSLGMVDPAGKLKESTGNLKEFIILDNYGNQLRFGEKS